MIINAYINIRHTELNHDALNGLKRIDLYSVVLEGVKC